MLTQLILEAKGLPQVSRAAAQSYQEKIQVLEKKPPEFLNLKIMVGGQGFNMIPELWKITGADGYAPDAQKAVELAQKW